MSIDSLTKILFMRKGDKAFMMNKLVALTICSIDHIVTHVFLLCTGKFGQRLNMRQTKFFRHRDIAQFHALVGDSTKKLVDFHICQNGILVEYEGAKDFVPENYRTNIFVAVMTTSQARLRLYSALETVGDKALYCDTDSCIYLKTEESPDIPESDLLGGFTDELDGHHITEFVTGGR